MQSVAHPEITEFEVGNSYDVTLTVLGSNGQTDTCSSTLSISDTDSDGDGVLDCDDLCPDSVLDDVNSLKNNHFQYDDASKTEFSTVKANLKGNGNQASFTISQTRGCTCTDIVATCDYGQGFLNFGCSKGVMELFTDPSGPLCEGEEAPYPAFN